LSKNAELSLAGSRSHNRQQQTHNASSIQSTDHSVVNDDRSLLTTQRSRWLKFTRPTGLCCKVAVWT